MGHSFRHFSLYQLPVACIAVLLTMALAGCVANIGIADRELMPAIPGEGVVAYAAGDIADCRKFSATNSGAASTAAVIKAGLEARKDAVVLTLGDHTYPNGRLAEFTDCYEPTWGQFKHRTFPAPGNHEYYTRNASGYYDYFADRAGPGRRGYYSFVAGNWHIISLNSNLRNPMEHHAQLEWLRAELAQHNMLCTLAYWHHPVFSSGGHGDNPHMQEVWQVLFSAGAELVLTAHDHDYERFAPLGAQGELNQARGMRQFVIGTGGATLTPFRFRRPNSQGGSNSTHGVLKLVLKELGYEWEFLPVAKDGFSDRGAAWCH